MPENSMLEQQRDLIARTTETLTPESLLAIPPGRKNSIAWNLGHITTVQQQLTYGLSGLPLGVPTTYPTLFGKDSSPTDWQNAPDLAEVLSLLRSTATGFEADYAAGRFTKFKPYTMSLTKISVTSIEEAAAFNVFHEGLHFGIVLSIMRELGLR